MFTIHHPELDEMARSLRDLHREFLAGEWDEARVAAHQARLLRQTISYVKERSPFYRARLDGAAEDDDLGSLPFTTKQDLRDAQFDMLSRPMHEAWIFYETTGTTGRATPCPRDNTDTLHNNTVLTAYYQTVFDQYGDRQVVGVSGPSELHATGDTFGDVCRNLGIAVAKMWPHSPMIGFDRALEVMRMLPVTGLFATPGMALSLAKKAREAGLDPAADFSLDVLMLTGELASPSLLAGIGALWGARAYNALYASQEASVLAASGADGGLYTAPLINHYEVIDPVTLRPARADGAGVRQGELVITNLYQGAKPLVRYRTGDMVRMHPVAPGATIPAPRVEVLGRVGDQIMLNGHAVTGYDLEDLLLRHVGGFMDYQIRLERTPLGEDRVDLMLHGASESHPGLVLAQEECREVLGTELVVSFGDPGSITSTGAMVSWKAARVVDGRGDEPARDDRESRAALALAARRG
ncbi:phenylacetate--CoA ligase family protein [Sphaerisporangium rhizosphaerae]|uniref:Phenylacetate--CoA ligase family protein n=1 Tax=Sphaerisporangium rhizosphaerae TaxID=2269375 RepID=A0ABW2PAF8_9ACTN